jgi:hypothetical protein
MSSWLLSIAGIVVIGALIEVLLTDSSVHKFVRSIYAFFVLFIIAQPIPGFFRNTVAQVQTGVVLELDTQLIQTINSQTAAAMQRNAMTALSTAGFDSVIVTIDVEPNANFIIRSIYINAFDVVLRANPPNINIKQEIIKIVRAVTGASEEVIHYVGQI